MTPPTDFPPATIDRTLRRIERYRVELPALPSVAPPAGFPLLATVAPVGVSIAIWAVTGSAFALLFAALGPAVGLASLADGRRQRRRRRRTERTRFLTEAAEVTREIVELHAAERAGLLEAARSASAILRGTRHDPDRWSVTSTDTATITLGRGCVDSSLQVDQARQADASAEPALVEARRRLGERARRLDDAPVLARLTDGIGVTGPAALCAPIARGLVLQLAALLSPRAWEIEYGVVEHGEIQHDWIAALPHRARQRVAESGRAPGVSTVRFHGPPGSPVVMVATAPERDSLPAGVRVVLQAATPDGAGGEPGVRVIRHPDAGAVGPIEVETVGRVQAELAAGWLALVADEDGYGARSGGVPEQVRLADLLELPVPAAQSGTAQRGTTGQSRASLVARFAADSGGPVAIDLVAAGPHAIVGGITGSGKSELLIAWVLALAAAYPPRSFTVLLVDFKGGASFAALESLPHCVGVISDLDEATALRALTSLRAELRHRERTLAEAGARSIDEWSDRIGPGAPVEHLARLVIVVDEFAAMVSGFPALHEVFADIAARGRSLGVHLVLATQRPAGVVRDAVLANSALRISLRVNNRSDSSAVIGTDAAAGLSPNAVGRALVSLAGSEPFEVQVALAGEGDSVRVAAMWTGEADRRTRRPWLPPLPGLVPLADLAERGSSPAHNTDPATGGLPFALADRPDEQSQPVVQYRPGPDGPLLVLGGARSGKSTALAALEHLAREREHLQPLRAGAAVEDAWDLIVHCAELVRSERRDPESARLLIIDDLDAVYSRLPEEYGPSYAQLLAGILREGPRAGITLVASAARVPSALTAALASCETRLLLRHPGKQDFLIAGGSSDRFDPAVPPGGGHWLARGGCDRVQVGVPSTFSGPGRVGRDRETSAAEREATVIDPASSSLLVVAQRPAETAAGVRARLGAGSGTVIELGAATVPESDPRALVIAAGQAPVIIVGDPETWLSHWGAIAALGTSVPVLWQGCSLADYRALSRSRLLPPLVSSALAGTLFTLTMPDGSVGRARWA